RFARNRIRHELLPLLQEKYSPSVRAILAATAEVARDEEHYWAERAREAAGRICKREGNALILDAEPLGELHPALRRRVLRLAIQEVKGDLQGIDIAHIERLAGLASESEGHGRLQLPGVDVMRSFR